jgi:CHAT domain-containing protein
MSNSAPLDAITRVAGALAAFLLAVCAAGVGQLPKSAATQRETIAHETAGVHIKHSERTVSPEAQFEEALALRKDLTEASLRIALRLMAESTRQFVLSGRLDQAAATKLEAGDVLFMMSSYRQAIAAYRQALNMSADSMDLRCAALSRMARTYAAIGQPEPAQRFSGDTVKACMTAADKKTRAAAVEAGGETQFLLGNLTDAVESFTRARELAAEAEDHDGEGLATMMLSQATDDRQQSDRLAWSALTDFVSSGNEYSAARAHLNLAYLAIRGGDFETARCHCETALPIFQRIADKDNAAIALNILGMVSRQSGELEEALSDYRRARNDFAAVGDDLGEGESINAIANILLSQRKYANLKPLYVRKLHLARSTSNQAFRASALLDLAGIYARQHHYAEADETYQESLAAFHSAGLLVGLSDALERRAGLQAELGRYQQALQMLAEAQGLREQSGEIESVARIQAARARLLLKLNDVEGARSEIEKTIAAIESQRLRIAKFDSRAQYFASVHEYYSLYIQVLMALDKLHPQSNYAELAFEAAERSKVRSLLDLLENTQEPVRCDTLLARHSSLAATEEVKDKQALSVTRPLTLEDVKAQIGDGDTLLVEFALGEDRSVAWVVDGDNLEAFEIAPAAEIRNRVRLFRKALLPLESKANETPADFLRRREAARKDLRIQSRLLAKALFGPLHLPPRNRLLIVPDGPLQYLPFGALAMPGDGHSDVLLVQRYELGMLPSASALLSLRKSAAKRPRPADEVTVFADPAFEPPGTSAPAAASGSSGLPRTRELTRAIRDLGASKWIPNLPGSRNEAIAIQQVTGRARTRLIMGVDANREALKTRSITTQRIIHFATHGVMDARHPENSGLVLSMVNKKGEYQDGYLRVNDIYNLTLSADLVVLSSCESALGKDLGSEGIMGLPRAFLYAGARSVVASMWKVDDDATVPLMKTFYSRLQRGEAPSRALREAQLEMIRNTQFSEPYYWAAFVIEGDYR